MGNLTTSFRKFLQNKNTVTVIGIVLGIMVIYIAYTMRIKAEINPITVPYAAEQIKAGAQITESMISTRKVPPSMLEGEVITNLGDIVDKYAAADTVIPKGSLFYKRSVVGKLISNIEVLAVKDSAGQPVFQNIDENRTPAMVVFAVPEEYFILLKKTEYMRTYDTSLILVPTNESLKDDPGDLEISSDQLKQWINDHTYWTE